MRLTFEQTQLSKIADALHKAGARAILVGGAVRDLVMGTTLKDFDVEVYSLDSLDTLEALLKPFGSVSQVGKSFGVVKLHSNGEEYDFSLPRTEEKTGRGHRGFDVTVNGSLDFATAARRRDFTINAMGLDIQSGEIIDPYGGLQDIQNGMLRHIDDATFIEDPLRIYRAMQFAARFGFRVAPETAALCKEMVREGMLEELPKERVYAEWKKLLLKAPKPSVGFELMREWGITERYFPQLHALICCPQDPKWHPEGDVWIHTMMSVDAMQQLLDVHQEHPMYEKQRLKLLFVELCHDLGKPVTTTIEFESGEVRAWKEILSQNPFPDLHNVKRVRSTGHERAGIEPTRDLLYRLTDEHDFIESILPLVEHHLKPSQFYAQGAKAGTIRRLATKVNIEELVLVAKADFLGRTTPEAQQGEYAAGEWLLKEAQRLQVKDEPLKPLILGRDLIALGMRPSPHFKTILDDVYEKQMDGTIGTKKDALAYIRSHFHTFLTS